MATVNLGSIKFNWQGAYDNATAYAVDDVVSSGGNSYVCIAATTGNTPPNATYWELMASKGTDTSVLTTQGDVLYHDGSSLARLGAGTSGQVLQTNGTGANPSWGTVSSDFVKLAETSITSSTANFSADVFSTDYKTFKIYINGLKGTSASANAYCRLRQSNATLTSSNYTSHCVQGYWDFASINAVGVHNETQDVSYGALGQVGVASGDYSMNLEITVFNASNSNSYPFIAFENRIFDNNSPSRIREQFGTIFYNNTTNPLSGIEFYQDSNIEKGQFSIYGLK